MGIITEKIELNEDDMIEDEMETNQYGKFNVGRWYSIYWSLDLLSETITLNITNRPDLGIKVINRKNTVAEFRVDTPRYRKLYAKLSGDFNSKQLSLSGNGIVGNPRTGWRTRTYENVIIISW
jgi:hypothetical protein